MYQLAGAEEGWQTTARGMMVICQFLSWNNVTGWKGRVVAQFKEEIQNAKNK
jgi:hypothetical protein